MIKRHPVLLFAALLVLICATLVGKYYYRLNHVESVFWSSQQGTTRTTIERAIGAPDRIRDVPADLWWGDDRFPGPKNTGECTSWVSYEFFEEAYAFGYNSAGELTTKYHYCSE